MTGLMDANYERKPKEFYFHFVSIERAEGRRKRPTAESHASQKAPASYNVCSKLQPTSRSPSLSSQSISVEIRYLTVPRQARRLNN
jgi:hypothetical protein